MDEQEQLQSFFSDYNDKDVIPLLT